MVVFDFDHTMIEDNSDTWIVVEFGLTDLFDQLRRTLPWTSLMDRMMEELHLQGKTVEDIARCLRRAPMDLQIISAIRKARDCGCELWIISDANQFFIDTILNHHGLLGCFTKIVTNPSLIDHEGRLRILPYHNSSSSPHGCNICPSNLCKGMVIEEIQVSMSKNGEEKMIYVGDGNGDYCPSLKLGEKDHVMPRTDFPLWKKINKNHKTVKAKIRDWGNGEELERILMQLIDDANSI